MIAKHFVLAAAVFLSDVGVKAEESDFNDRMLQMMNTSSSVPTSTTTDDQDPTVCVLDDSGETFTCTSERFFTVMVDDTAEDAPMGETYLETTAVCPYDEALGLDLYANECECSVLLNTTVEDADGSLGFQSSKTCMCMVCPQGSDAPYELDCSMQENELDKFVVGDCMKLGCDAICADEPPMPGPGLQPTPGPMVVESPTDSVSSVSGGAVNVPTAAPAVESAAITTNNVFGCMKGMAMFALIAGVW